MSSHSNDRKNSSSSSSPQRRTSASIRKFMARHANNLPASKLSKTTSTNDDVLMPIRPEALRPYASMGDDQRLERNDLYPSDPSSSSSSSHHPQTYTYPQEYPNSFSLSEEAHHQNQSIYSLQQAANYANLARLNVDISNSTNDPVVRKVENQSNYSRELPDQRSTRQGLIRTRSGQHIIKSLESVNHSGVIRSPDRTLEDNGIWEAAPRLSISSIESNGGSEVKTPESLNAHLSWQGMNAGKGKGSVTSEGQIVHHLEQSFHRHSPSMVDMSDAIKHAHGLAAVGFAKAEDVVRSSTNPELVAAAQNIDNDPDSVDYQQFEEKISASRAPTIKKSTRPDGLLKLSRSSYRTDRTITPTSSEPSSAIESLACRPLQTNAEEEAVLSSKSIGSSKVVKESPNLGLSVEFPSPLSSPQLPRTCIKCGIHPTVAAVALCEPPTPPRSVASPDSWRSLLPEHDPYFIPSDVLSSRTSSIAGSDALSGVSISNLANVKDDDRRRWSNDSQQSNISLSEAATKAGLAALYDLDGKFNSGGSRTAFAPLQYCYNESSRSLTSPKLSQQVAQSPRSEAMRKQATTTTAEERSPLLDSQKRHASFSTFDNGHQYQKSSFRHVPFVHPDYINRAPTKSMSSSISSGLGSISGGISPGLISVVNDPSDGIDEIKKQSFNKSKLDESIDKILSTNFDSAIPGNLRDSDIMSTTATTKGNDEVVDDLQTLASSPSSIISTMAFGNIDREMNGDILTTRTTTTTTTSTTTTKIVQERKADKPPVVSCSSDYITGEGLKENSFPRVIPTGSVSGASEEEQYGSDENAVDNGVNANGEHSSISSTPPHLQPFPIHTDVHIEQHEKHYIVNTIIPGFRLEAITLAVKRQYTLVIVAEKWDNSKEGRFERRIKFGTDANLDKTKADFDGFVLHIIVPRHGQ